MAVPVDPHMINRNSWTPGYDMTPRRSDWGNPTKPDDQRTHELRESQWPFGGMVTRPIDDRRFDVQEFTGYPVSNVDKGNWARGQIIRQFQPPPIHPPMLGYFSYDPTDPTTWHQPQV